MVAAPPRIRLDELFLEIQLTARKHIIVEGHTDERFIQAWLQDIRSGESVVVTQVGSIHVDAADVEQLGFADGNRGRVVLVAVRAAEANVDLRAIADRDCGHHVATHTYPTLCWTDFPALESYALDATTLERANLLSFEGRLPEGPVLLAQLAPALRDLFAVRLVHEHLEQPNYSAGLANRRSLAEFDVAAAVHIAIRAEVPSYERPSGADPREFAYGHDIGELLLAAFANVIRNQVGLQKLSAVESALRSAVQVVGSYKTEPMFLRLQEWIAA